MTDEFRLRASDGSQPQSRMAMTDGERLAVTADDELRSTVRLPPVADGVQPAATVVGDELQSTMRLPPVADDVRPTAMVCRRTVPPCPR